MYAPVRGTAGEFGHRRRDAVRSRRDARRPCPPSRRRRAVSGRARGRPRGSGTAKSPGPPRGGRPVWRRGRRGTGPCRSRRDRRSAGQRRGGIALAGIRPKNNFLRVRRAGGDFVLDGFVPWVTGWGMLDVLYVGARDAENVVHFLLMDAAEAPTLRTETQRLVAVQASNTVNMTFDGHVVPADRLVSAQPFEEWRAGDSGGSSLNGFLAFGVIDRCVRLLRSTADTAADPAGATAA